MFVAPRDGMGSLVAALPRACREGRVRLNATVERIDANSTAGWRLHVQSPATSRHSIASALIVAAPAYLQRPMLAAVDTQLADNSAQIPYAGTAIVTLAYRRDQIAHPLDGFGFVVPAVEQRRILAASFSSVKFPGRAPSEQVLIRVFIGGACQSELLDVPDDELVSNRRRGAAPSCSAFAASPL